MRLDDDGRYASFGIGCYLLDACINGRWWTFDATGTINDPRRYISCNANLILMKPMRIEKKYRIGFVAKCDICKGDKLFYHYGIHEKMVQGKGVEIYSANISSTIHQTATQSADTEETESRMTPEKKGKAVV